MAAYSAPAKSELCIELHNELEVIWRAKYGRLKTFLLVELASRFFMRSGYRGYYSMVELRWHFQLNKSVTFTMLFPLTVGFATEAETLIVLLQPRQL